LSDFLPSVIDKTVPETWSPTESIEKINGLYNIIVDNMGEIAHELCVAAYYYKNKSWLVSCETKYKSFSEYCEYLPFSRATAYRLMRVKNPHFLSSSPKWNTPKTIINKTIQLFGSIDLDPCSNSYTNPNVPAERHYTTDDDGLIQPWHGRVYMNPPYGNEIGKWTEKLRIEYEEARTTQGIALVPSRTDTEWFRNLDAFPRCFVWGRLRFSEYENSAPFPSMVVYLGRNVGQFVEIFCDMGSMYACITGR